MTSPDSQASPQDSAAEEARRSLRQLAYPTATRAASFIVILNFIFLYGRPQFFIPALAFVKITIVLFLLSFLVFLPRIGLTINATTKALWLFLGFEAILIFIGRFIYDDMILNDGRALLTLKDLLQMFSCFLFPLAAYLRTTYEFRRFSAVFAGLGFYLGIVSIARGGVGPGDFLLDENDLGLALNMLLPFSLLMIPSASTFRGRLALFVCAAVTTLGCIRTTSRGSFVGLVATFSYMWIRSPKKIQLTLAGLVLCGLALPFIPQKYLAEIQDLSNVSSAAEKGTGKERIDSWKIGMRMWLDPQHFVQGVGLNNAPWQMEHYEGAEFKTGRPTLAGRHVHSMFVQMVADNGLIGLIFFGWLFIRSFSGNRRVSKEANRLRTLVQRASAARRLQATPTDDPAENARTERDLQFLEFLGVSLNASWIGVLSSGAFISVFYYPPFWILLVVSAAFAEFFKIFRHAVMTRYELGTPGGALPGMPTGRPAARFQ